MKKILTITTSTILLAIVVSTFFMTFTTHAQNVVGDTPVLTESSIITQKLINLINQLNKVDLGNTFFKESAYNSLIDYSKPIDDEARGRPNPFAPIGI